MPVLKAGSFSVGRNMLKKFIGTKDFYKMVMLVALPIMIQNGFTNIVNMVDNVMVGRVGTDAMNGVSIVNQILMVYNLSVFGALSGAGIFTSQFFGKGDRTGVKNVFRIKLFFSLFIIIIGYLILYFFRGGLITGFINDGGNIGNPLVTYDYADRYIKIMLLGIIPFTLGQCFTSSMRETGETLIPMYAGIVAVFVNIFFNYVLIFGKLGFPKLGVEGAAIATVISRVVECIIVILVAHIKRDKFFFAENVFKGPGVPVKLTGRVLSKGIPLMVNEFLWSLGMTMQALAYSERGLATVGAVNISNTVNNVFSIVFIAFGSSVSIIVGQLLGAGKKEEARDTDTKLIAFSVLSCILVSLVMISIAPFFPNVYNTEPEVKVLATKFIIIMAAMMPFDAFTHAAYFTLRSGGKTGITFIFDSGYMWLVTVPVALSLAFFTDISPVMLFLSCNLMHLIKAFIGYFCVKSDIWMVNMVGDDK